MNKPCSGSETHVAACGGGCEGPARIAAYAHEIEGLARQMIGCFPVACGGRHHHGHTCDYCLADDVLRATRALVARLED